MSLKVEKLEGNMALLTIEAPAEDFEAAVQRAYLKNKNQIQITGFRKGKAPRAMIEKIYGAGVFYEEAANDVLQTAYPEALASDEAKELEIVSSPEIDVIQMGKDQAFIFTAKVALKPVVELGEYKNLGLEKPVVEVTDEDVDAELKRVQEQNARSITVEDRAVMDGDDTTIDFEGFVDGKAFEGGKGNDYALKIGSHSFIDTFEEQLIGKNIGEECEVNVTFPEDYNAKDLAGKAAMFKVTVKGIKTKELPELNDEFAEEVSDFDTLDEYKADLKKTLVERKQKDADSEYEKTVVAKIVENAKMEIPDAMVETEARRAVDQYAQQLAMQGLSMEQYMQWTGMTVETMVGAQKETAKTRIQNSLVLEAVAKAENIEVTEDDVKAEIEEMAKMYQMEVDKLEGMIGEAEKETIKNDLAVRKALKVVTE